MWMNYYRLAKKFIFKNARPLDMARWNYLFEGASKEEVIKVLEVYQNADGGFGSALEPDCWNAKSTPMQTWVATRIVKEIQLEEKEHPIIKGILKYLASGDAFDGYRWSGLSTVHSNNDYPHASWWSYTEDQEWRYNPTASLIGFILLYDEIDSVLYKKACELAKEAFVYFETYFPLESMHEVACFVELYEAMSDRGGDDLIDLERFGDLLQQQIKQLLTYDTGRWEEEYICKPSLFISSKSSDFYLANKEICHFECDFIKRTQRIDGTWRITWEWEGYPVEWAISKNWWKSDMIINNMKYLKAFCD